MVAKRIAALVGALLLIGGAMLLRGFLDDGGSVAVGREGSPVVCDPLVIEACKRAFPDVEVTEEQPGVTLTRLLDQRNPDAFVWVTAQIWFDILEDEITRQGRANPVGDGSTGLVTSPRLLIHESDVEICESPERWACLASGEGGAADLDVGLDSTESTIGVLSRADLVTGYFGRSDFASNDFATSEFRSWWNQTGERLVAAQRSSALDDLLVLRGRIDVAPSVVAVWARIARAEYTATQSADGAPDLLISAAAVGEARLDTDDLAELLAEAGWEPADPDPVRLPDAVSPGVLQALREL
ncbi:MAG: hypothetical protein O3C27_12475 [Actinomycetota bacterium]|nr:hypothetical protein [Actinomycetota bacterium]